MRLAATLSGELHSSGRYRCANVASPLLPAAANSLDNFLLAA